MSSEVGNGGARRWNKTNLPTIGLCAGALIFLATLIFGPPAGMSPDAWRVAGMGLLMALWWMTEAIPIPVTSLVPLAILPVLQVADIRTAAAPYAHPLIFLFLGGFFIAEAIQKAGLHKRFALFILSKTGDTPNRIVGGFMLATAFLSMWVSNTATTLMILPIGISVVKLAGSSANLTEESIRRFGTLLMLSIAYAASVGGIGTLIGTPPNALMAGFLEETYGIVIGFAEWMLVGLPIVILGLPLVYLVLTRGLFKPDFTSIPGGRHLFVGLYRSLGKMTVRERRVITIFLCVALGWMSRPLLEGLIPGLSDSGISITGAILLFVIPSGKGNSERLLTWTDAVRIPWGVLILFGGGLSLAAAISNTGLADWIGSGLGQLSGLPTIVLVLIFSMTVIFLTELTSNTATAAAFLPVVGSVAVALNLNPLTFVIPATVAASCAFMLPVATPPNAIVYGSGFMRLSDMARAGIVLNILFILLITVLSLALPLLISV
ncbi:MAG: DASS family sodium-coupled anion symporter [Bacteroidetes bacterium]|nr:DASS family sodium-coupled anion symporter [Bacteroidota bacterium]